jgi:hypothetical protein
MWNERHGKHNWNKDGFKIYIGCHLKEVVILPNPRRNQDARSNHCTLFLDNSCPLNGSRKSPHHFGFQRALLGSSSMSIVWSMCP